jgi:hypothetical protein
MKLARLLGIIAFILGCSYAYVGFRFTLYGLGVYLVPVVVIVSAFGAVLTIVWKKEWHSKYLPVFYSFTIFLFSYLLIDEGVRNYKPTVTVHVPENYFGMVHIFFGEGEYKDIYVNQNGIGYFEYHGEVNFEILHGQEDVSDVLNESGNGQIEFWKPDSSEYEVINVACFELVPDRKYPTTPWNNKHSMCVDKSTYLDWKEKGWIDEKKILKKPFAYSRF